MPDERIPPEDNRTPSEDTKKNNGFSADLFAWLQALTIALLVLIVIFTFFGRIIGVDGFSMESTLDDKDMLLLQCIAYEPKQGDIVVLHKNFGEITSPIVKRVIAVGGQTVEIDYPTSTVYVDGQPVDEPYINEAMLPPGSPYMQHTYWEVPEGSVFVMGDNRNASSDSRDDRLGCVDTRYILGHALYVIFPFQHFGSVAN